MAPLSCSQSVHTLRVQGLFIMTKIYEILGLTVSLVVPYSEGSLALDYLLIQRNASQMRCCSSCRVLGP